MHASSHRLMSDGAKFATWKHCSSQDAEVFRPGPLGDLDALYPRETKLREGLLFLQSQEELILGLAQ